MKIPTSFLFLLFNLFLDVEGQKASAKAHEVVDHLASVLSSREEISQSEIEPPTSTLRFGYLSNIIQ